MTETAADLRSKAVASERAAAELFERCDTDGFLSQWALGLSAQKDRLQAEIVENGGRSEFPALFDADGELIAAKIANTRYGLAWVILPSDDPRGSAVAWFHSSKARDHAKRIAANLKKGYRLGRVMAKARADIGGGGTGLAGAASCYAYARRIDGGFSRDVEVVSIEGLIGSPTDGWS